MNYNKIQVEYMLMTSKRTQTIVFMLLPLVVASLIMLPRLVSPQFGIMDDGLIYVEVQKILDGDFSMTYDLQAGRFRPIYWAYFTLIYTLAGPNPFWFFFGQLLVLMVLLLEIRQLMKAYRAEDWQVLLASLVFVFSIPIIENFYTLSKGDPLSLVFILASLLCLEKHRASNHNRTAWLYPLLAFASGLLAIWAKETAYIMTPISACWWGFAVLNRKTVSAQDRKSYLLYFISMTAAMGAFFLIRAMFGAPSVTDGSFTARYDLSWGALIERIPRWITLFASYYHYLLPFAALVMIILFSKNSLPRRDTFQFYAWGIWLLAWMGVLLPWEYARAYYLLAFSLGVAILVGLFAPYIAAQIKTARKNQRRIIAVLSVLWLLMFIASLTHFRTHARTQLIFDRMNSEMLAITREITPPDGMVFVSLEERKEYVEGIEYFLLDFYGLSEIKYTHIDVETLERLHWYSEGVVIMPYVRNMPSLVVRAGVDNDFTMLWNEIVMRNKGNRLIPVSEVRAEFQLFNLNLPVVFCPLVGPRGFCENPDPFLDTRLFSYGWDIFTIK